MLRRPRTPEPDAPTLAWAYAHGIFPMVEPGSGRIEWYSPDPRAVVDLAAVRVPRSLARTVRSGRFEIASDVAFVPTMRACADRHDGAATWIDERLVRAYADLHGRGLAHSVEARRDGVLVGGLYGVHLGAAFFGESMFVRPDLGGTDASKVCFVHLVAHLRARGFRLLDSQFANAHMSRFGLREIPREDYLARLETAIAQPRPWEWDAGGAARSAEIAALLATPRAAPS